MTYEEKYNMMYGFIHTIAHDYVELSHDKVRVQRDYYIKQANKILDKLHDDHVEQSVKYNDEF